jgi:hypothetical protein
MCVLNDIASVDNPGRALANDFFRAREDLQVAGLSAAPHEHGNLSGRLDNLAIDLWVVRWIGFDDIGPQFHRLANQRHDLIKIAIDHVAAGFLVWAEHERLDHQRHGVPLALGLQLGDVLDALIRHLRLIGNLKEIDSPHTPHRPAGPAPRRSR